MKKFSVLLFVFFAAVLSCAAQPLAIGSKVQDFKFEVWYQNKKAPVEKWLGKKTVAILFVTTTMPDHSFGNEFRSWRTLGYTSPFQSRANRSAGRTVQSL